MIVLLMVSAHDPFHSCCHAHSFCLPPAKNLVQINKNNYIFVFHFLFQFLTTISITMTYLNLFISQNCVSLINFRY